MLSKNRSGATSFDALKTVEVFSKDQKSACIVLNLCKDDSQWIDCVNKAKDISVPQTICKLFCNILTNCEHASPSIIYKQFNSLTGRLVLARSRFSSAACALKAHRFNLTYVGIVEKISRHPTSTIQHLQNNGTIVPTIGMQTMASITEIHWCKPRDAVTDALFRIYPAVFR